MHYSIIIIIITTTIIIIAINVTFPCHHSLWSQLPQHQMTTELSPSWCVHSHSAGKFPT